MSDPKNGSAPKKTSRKLKLSKTTIRQLNEEHLGEAAGGGTIVACTATDTTICETIYCTLDMGCVTIGPSNGNPCGLSIPKHVC